MNYIVNVSGGLTSYEALRRCLATHGRDRTWAVFADTRVEDVDLYRFLDDIEMYLHFPIERVADGRNVFQVWHDEGAITVRVPGSGAGVAPCSQILKRDVIRSWIAKYFAEEPYTLVLGMDWSERDRMERTKRFYAPVPVWFPLEAPPYKDKCHIADDLEKAGIEVPALYREGFVHNNCGGGCVKAGQAHFAHLYRQRPATYARWEQEEERFREATGKDVAILVDRRGGGPRRPLTLREFRERIDAGSPYDTDEWGGCGCFAPVVQERMDILLDVDVK